MIATGYLLGYEVRKVTYGENKKTKNPYWVLKVEDPEECEVVEISTSDTAHFAVVAGLKRRDIVNLKVRFVTNSSGGYMKIVGVPEVVTSDNLEG